jgi:hypothetical protein
MKITNLIHTITRDTISQEFTDNLLPIYDKNKSLELKEKIIPSTRPTRLKKLTINLLPRFDENKSLEEGRNLYLSQDL